MNNSTKKNSIIAFFSISILVVFIFISCEKDSKEYTSEVQYYKQAQLTNIYENEIFTLNTTFIDETNKLRNAIEGFGQTPTTNLLTDAQAQWLNTLKVWKQMELYNVGDISKTLLHSEISQWPSNTEFINDFIEGENIINESFIASKGASSKGIAAIEYLLFYLEDNDAILNSFTIDDYNERRLNYVVAVSQNLNAKAQELADLWDSYHPEFTSNLENGVDGSQNEVINEMVAVLEEVIIYKLGKPLGDTSEGTIAINELEAASSGASLEIIAQHLLSIKRCYKGDFAQTPFRVGFDDFLILVGSEDFSEKISDQFKVCEEKILAIESPLKEEILTNPETVIALKDALSDLLALIKVDMANVLGSSITFNDNDGD